MFHIAETEMQPESRIVPVGISGELFLHLYEKARKENSTVHDILQNIIHEYMLQNNIKE